MFSKTQSSYLFFGHLFIVISLALCSCGVNRQMANKGVRQQAYGDTLITQSLFTDPSATISEENIQKILNNKYALPKSLMVAVVRLEGAKKFFWNDEWYLKSQQAYQDLFTETLRQSNHTLSVSIIPELMLAKTPSFTNIREAAVRIQADVVLVYSINTDLYSRYKLFAKDEIKAFATTQLLLMDVRTGLVPFSGIATKDFAGLQTKEDLDFRQAANRMQNEAVLLAIRDLGEKLVSFLKQ